MHKKYKNEYGEMANGDWRTATVVVTGKGKRGKSDVFFIAL